jgi:hypothetical protein
LYGKKSMSLTLALALALQPALPPAARPPAPVQRPSWRQFIGSPGSGSTMYVDMASVRRTGDIALTTLYLINDAPTDAGIKSMVMMLDINCRAHNALLVEAHGYTANGDYVNGSQYSRTGRVPQDSAPGSDDARLEQWVCAAPPARP